MAEPREIRASEIQASVASALANGPQLAPASAPSDKEELLTWTLKMDPQQAADWDSLVARLAGATGKRVGRSKEAINRRHMVEALVKLAEDDTEVWDKLVDAIRTGKPS
ncbi:hypothetical protein ACQP0C_41850 (plasmid) [Nocardia sp. CA-129566]|uniref:hypothetical protein n=1 Tax=Nocardia sp. CA-129566 TaxID=3239976 RepID=UPI003D97FEDE